MASVSVGFCACFAEKKQKTHKTLTETFVTQTDDRPSPEVRTLTLLYTIFDHFVENQREPDTG